MRRWPSTIRASFDFKMHCVGCRDGGLPLDRRGVPRRLSGAAGVGPVAALSFKVGVDDPRRFARSRTVGAHFGLTPRRHQSGTSIDYEGRISKQGDVAVREALCEAAASLSATGPEMVGIAGVGPADRQKIEHAVRDHRGRAQARRHPAPDVGQRDRLPRRLRRQDHAAAAIEACTVAAAGCTKN